MLSKSPNTGMVDLPIANTQLHLNKMIKDIPWEDSFGARKVCNVGCDYTYSGKTVKGQPFSIYKPLKPLLDKVNKHLNTNFNSILLNWYPKGTLVGIGAHSDNEPELVPGSCVASISLGATMPFHIFSGELREQITVDLKDGFVFLMGNHCQTHYQHRIVKQHLRQDRISLTFREFYEAEKIIQKPVSSIKGLVPRDFTNYTGGAYGVDTAGHLIGSELGFTNHAHFRPYNNQNLSRRLRDLTTVKAQVILAEDLQHARDSINSLLNTDFRDGIAGNLQARNYYQVLNAEAVFAVSRLATPSSVSGGTNTAVQLAIKTGKPVYVFDINSLQWFSYNPESLIFEPCDTPILSKNYALVGTRDIEDYHVRKGKNWGPRKEYVGARISNEVNQAIRNLYRNTLNHLKA